MLPKMKNLKNVLGLRELLREGGLERLGQEERLDILLPLMGVSEGILYIQGCYKVLKYRSQVTLSDE